ncbi:hypothetical protein NE237_025718 [Protea cynaroides]|uniref:Uncharacterized protein n=1 Tax=Protea cynaroides TaxID=273540 RepID=A0A9Q0K0S9_9MAGN|nr:hypothetical protein NE237_025718 [Protea cynaroides]
MEGSGEHVLPSEIVDRGNVVSAPIKGVSGDMLVQNMQVQVSVNADENEEVQVRTVTSSPGGSASIGAQGRVAVVFIDVAEVDDVFTEDSGEFSTVRKRLP